MAKKTKWSGDLNFSNATKDLVKKFNGTITELQKGELQKVVIESAKIPSADLKQFMVDHAADHSGKHTYDAYAEPMAVSQKKLKNMGFGKSGKKGFDRFEVVESGETTFYAVFGYDIEQGGLAALFWDIGTPTNTPKATYFVFYAINKNWGEISAAQYNGVMEILKKEGLM